MSLLGESKKNVINLKAKGTDLTTQSVATERESKDSNKKVHSKNFDDSPYV